ncbi:MAG: SsrA-binding protein SmpB [Trueperaceae bacterium]|nr:SsrA-binding protein SmpB [Trueperaceae bacterium]
MLKNRRASYDYELIDTFEAGIALTGSEVKSLREGGGAITDAFARVRNGEVWLEGLHIPTYQQASYNNHEPLRSRKLLLKRREIEELQKGIERKGLTVVPTRLYFKNGWAKVNIALARGKKNYDKRRSDAAKDAQRQIDRALKDRM